MPSAIVAVVLRDGGADGRDLHRREGEPASRRARSSTRRGRRARRGGRSASRSGRAPSPSRSSARRRPGSSGAVASASASAASFADWISAPLTRSATVISWPALEVDRLLADRGRARVDVDDVGELEVLERDDHRHQLRDRRDRDAAAGRRAAASTSPVTGFSTSQARASTVAAPPRPREPGEQARRRHRERGEAASHRRLSFSPMKSAVGETFGFSASEPRQRDAGAGRDRRERVAGAHDVDARRARCARAPGRACASPRPASGRGGVAAADLAPQQADRRAWPRAGRRPGRRRARQLRPPVTATSPRRSISRSAAGRPRRLRRRGSPRPTRGRRS